MLVEYRHKYHNRQHISKRKNPCFIVCTTASPAGPPSVTSGLGMLVQPVKPAPPVVHLCEQLPKVYAFSADEICTIFCAPFSAGILISMSWLCFRSMCSVHCSHKPNRALHFP